MQHQFQAPLHAHANVRARARARAYLPAYVHAPLYAACFLLHVQPKQDPLLVT